MNSMTGTTTSVIGVATPRIDGRLKVTGGARYSSDIPLTSPVFAFLVTSTIARGRITGFDLNEARGLPGVLDIMTWENTAGQIEKTAMFGAGGPSSTTIFPLQGPDISHDGEIVAVVLAESYEVARDAAHRVVVEVQTETPSAGFDSPGVTMQAGKDAKKTHDDPEVGDAEAAFAAAPVKVEGHYATPAQHHNPIELFSTTCSWIGEKLTVLEPSQFVYGIKNGLAQELRMDPANVRAISTYVGGAFGARGSLTPRTALIALAAKRMGRPVKLVATRDQGFTIATYRAETRHYVKLAADRLGRLQALVHEGLEITSRADGYLVGGTEATARLYACPNIATKVSVVHADRNTPGFMRSPAELPYMFALESAMDKLAVALNMDPIELRRVNDTKVEPIKGLQYTSRTLMPCFDAAAKAFGWSARNPVPGSMRDGDWLIGWGCASTMYPTSVAAATARVSIARDGRVRVQTAAHDVGTGTYTVVAMTAAERLGVPMANIEVVMADSDLPPAPVSGGSNVTASVCNVVAKACDQIRAKLARAAVLVNGGAFAGMDPTGLMLVGGRMQAPNGVTEELSDVIGRVGHAIDEYAENIPHGNGPDAVKSLYKGVPTLSGGARLKDRIQFAFGAEFVEVRVHRRTREIRCKRAVGAFAAGRIMNPTTARSQLMGGLIWGISSALHEATEIDQRAARYMNDNFAEYLIPVNADIDEIEVIFVPEEDRLVNDLGIKGLGELGNVGTNAAIANAVFHATGRRIRELPVRIEHLL